MAIYVAQLLHIQIYSTALHYYHPAVAELPHRQGKGIRRNKFLPGIHWQIGHSDTFMDDCHQVFLVF